MVKFRFYCDKDRETEFLNEMCRKGYAMTGFCACFYSFDKCLPGEYIYQIDITEGMFQVSNDYREFMKEVNVEIVCLWGPWVILRKKAVEGPFELYTDVESSIEHYTKIKRLFQFAAILEILCFLMEVIGALRGSTAALACSFLLAAFAVAMSREFIRVNGILAELKSRRGEEADGTGRRGQIKPSGFIALGFLLNAIGFLIMEPVESWQVTSTAEFLKGFFHGLALVVFIVGIIHTLWRKK